MTEGIEEEKKVTVSISKGTLWMIISLLLAITLIGTLFYTGVFSGITGFGPADGPDDGQPALIKYKLPADVNMKGEANAPITIIEFSDFECPFCGRFYTDTLPSVQSEWIDTGKAKLVYMQYPLSFHLSAMPAAKASECAADQEKFWEYHNKIFDNQASLATPGIFSQWAQELELNVEDFDTCYASTKHDAKIKKDMADGNTVGVSGTPSFLVGNEKDGYNLVVGAQPYAVFKQVLASQ